jgi:hypothetical protein
MAMPQNDTPLVNLEHLTRIDNEENLNFYSPKNDNNNNKLSQKFNNVKLMQFIVYFLKN